MNTGKIVRISLLLFMTLIANIRAQDTVSWKKDIIFFGGLLLHSNSDIESFGNKHCLEFDAGIEYFFLKRISTGIQLDYIIYSTEITRNVFNGDYYTSAYVSWYTKTHFYLKPAITLRFKPTDKTYPLEFRYCLGVGKRFFLTKHITWKLETNLTRYREQVINSDGVALQNKIIMISFNAGLQIYINSKSNLR